MLTDEQADQLLDYLMERGQYEKACCFALARYSGRRKSELTRFKVSYFDDENIMHVVADTSTNVPVDPPGSIGVIDIELIMADVEMVERRIDKAQKAARGTRSISARWRCSPP